MNSRILNSRFFLKKDAYCDETLEGKIDPKIVISKTKTTAPIYSSRVKTFH